MTQQEARDILIRTIIHFGKPVNKYGNITRYTLNIEDTHYEDIIITSNVQYNSRVKLLSLSLSDNYNDPQYLVDSDNNIIQNYRISICTRWFSGDIFKNQYYSYEEVVEKIKNIYPL